MNLLAAAAFTLFSLLACGGGAGGGPINPAPSGGDQAGSGPPPEIPIETACLGASAYAAGLPALPAVASASLDFPAGTWKELPDTTMETVFPPKEGHPAWAVQGPKAVTLAWGGAAFDTSRNRLIITGGGHGDYGGNEVYEFDLATQKWTRTTNPSAMVVDTDFADRPQPDAYVKTQDGTPVSSHTYNGLLYLPPPVDRMFKFGGSYYQIGNSYDPHPYFYNPANAQWERRAQAPRNSLEVSTAYDPHTGLVIVGTPNGIMAYDPVQDGWATLHNGSNQNFGRVAALDPVRCRLVQTASSHVVDNTRVPLALVYHGLTPPTSRQIAPVTGDDGFKNFSAPGIVYHPPSDRFVIWAGDRAVWTVNAQTFVATRHEPPGAAPDHNVPNYYSRMTAGIYSRWQYVPAHDLFIAYPHSTENVWLYRLPN